MRGVRHWPRGCAALAAAVLAAAALAVLTAVVMGQVLVLGSLPVITP